MITLTTPPQINSVLGGSAPVNYDKLVIGPFTFSPSAQTVQASLQLTATAQPDMQAIQGTLRISIPEAVLEVAIQQLDFYRRIRLNSGQNTAVLNIITSAQTSLENGLVSLGIISGVQSAGA